ncbi:MAG: hypothetical protein M3Q27_19125 [Actinomycetota bacterium]|nr:hypothetical protein [Actinomycetota bacterium]
MTATTTVKAGTATDVLVVPVTAVLGTVDTGTVWIVTEDGAQEKRAVPLGLTDGQLVEVREDLAEGARVRAGAQRRRGAAARQR